MIRSVLSIALVYLRLAAGMPQTSLTGPVTCDAAAVRFGILPAFPLVSIIIQRAHWNHVEI